MCCAHQSETATSSEAKPDTGHIVLSFQRADHCTPLTVFSLKS